MKAVLSNEKFMICFATGTLGTKSYHGGLYVVTGEHCSILMYKTPLEQKTRLIGIKFNKSNIVLLSNLNLIGIRLRKYPDMSTYKENNVNILTVNLEKFYSSLDPTKSELINTAEIYYNTDRGNGHDGKNKTSKTSALINIENSKYLVDTNVFTKKKSSVEDFITRIDKTYLQSISRLNETDRVVFKVDNSAVTVADARKALIPPEVIKDERSFLYDNLWFVPDDGDYECEVIDKTDLEIMSNVPNRYKFGLGPEYSNIDTISNNIDLIKEKVPETIKIRLEKYFEAHKLYEQTCEKYKRITIENNSLKGIYITSTKLIEGGVYQHPYNGNVYVKGGIISAREQNYYSENLELDCFPRGRLSNDVDEVNNWHRIIPINKVC